MSSEHIRKNIPCSEFCYIDPSFCPLCNIKSGDDAESGPLKMEVQRWSGKSMDELQNDPEERSKDYMSMGIEKVQIDFSEKKTPGDIDGGNKDWDQSTGTEIYEQQIAYEHSRFSPFSCWADGSGFEFDIMPDNLVGNKSSMESLYDLSYYPMNYKPMQMSDWNAWIDKFQVDYRWGQVSDQNAETILFPNVDDPWMFTEYIFQGVKSGEAIVEPTLYDEHTLEIINADKEFVPAYDSDLKEKYSNEKYVVEIVEQTSSSSVSSESSSSSQSSDSSSSSAAAKKTYKWKVRTHRVVQSWRSDYPVPDAGGKLYKVDIPVESVKWGEHGNVPPGTVNMGAPKSWMDPGQNNAKIVPKYIAHIGSPFYASSYGVLYWYNKEAWIDPIELSAPVDDSNGKPQIIYEIKENGEHGVKQNTPEEISTASWSMSNGVQSVNIHMDTGDYSHGGCSLLKGSGGCLKCLAIDAASSNAEVLALKQHFGIKCASYDEKNTDCPKFVASSQYPILADYESTAADGASFKQKLSGIYSKGVGGYSPTEVGKAENILNNGAFGSLMNLLSPIKTGRPDIYNDNTQINVWYEAQFDIKYESDNSVKTNKSASSQGFGKGVEVIRGSGKMALDTKENSNGFRGDTVFFGDMDQVSYSRWFTTPMFCANSAYCNSTCGSSMQQGFSSGERAGSSKGKCRYYRSNGTATCPILGVNKRALEFQETVSRCSPILESVAEFWSNSAYDKRQEINAENPSYHFIRDESYTPSIDPEIKTDQLYSLYAFYSANTGENSQIDYSSEVSKIYGGIKVKSTQSITRTRLDDSTETKLGYLIGKVRIYVKDVYRFSEAYFWYDAMDNDGRVLDTWFCKCDIGIHKFKYNTFIITNDKKFIGGYHPQYKDYSKRGEEYLMDVESDSYRDAMGDIIGDVDHDGQPQAVNKQGYWTDESGDYIIDEKSIGVDQEINGDMERKEPGSPVVISFKKSNTFIDGETGEVKKPKTVSCAVYSNDPSNLLYFYKNNGTRSSHTYYDANDNLVTSFHSEGRPEYEDDEGRTYWAPPYIGNEYGIPTMRLAAHCPKCDYYISWKYHDLKCPWCGTLLERITGSEGLDEFSSGTGAIGKKWPKNASIIKKFFKINAIGTVQVWAPPGTCVPLDGFYWKNPTVVTNTMIRQLKYRLGELNDNGWTPISTMSREKDFSMGYPEQMGYYKKSKKFESESDDQFTIYEKIKWDGVSKSDREKYSSVNEIMAPNMLPGFVTDGMNEQFIVPYTSVADDGIKLLKYDEISSIRNRLEPVMAYVSGNVQQEDYPVLRASYEKRTTSSIPRYSLNKKCQVPSMILAANDTGFDAYVQFWSGDSEWGSVREYYPPGLSWWWLNQVIGARYSSMDGGVYHMDSPSFGPNGGHRTVSKCAMFIHGILPLDKEILKAYLIFSPAGEPSKEPIGRGWNGVNHYEHYHANNTDKTWDDMNKKWVCPHKQDGRIEHLHGQAGWEGIWDANGDYHDDKNWKPTGVTPMSEGGYFGWGGESDQPDSYRSIYDDHFDEWQGLCGLKDSSCWTQFGEPKINIGTNEDPIYVYKLYDSDSKTGIQNTGIEYNSRTSAQQAEDQKYKYIGVDSSNNIRLNYTQNEIWQEISQDDFVDQSENSKVHVVVKISDGTKENEIVKEFDQYSQQYVNSVYPSQMQSIAGYFNLEGINGEQRLSDAIDLSERTSQSVLDHPIIIQTSGGNSKYSGSNEENDAGIIPRVVDVTPLVKKLYDTRIDRSFNCKAGKSLEETIERDFNKDEDGNKIPRWDGSSGGQIKEINWNKQERWNEYKGYLLNDLYSYPKILDDNSLPGIPDEGEKYELSPRTIEFVFDFVLPIEITEDNCNYEMVEKNNGSESKTSGSLILGTMENTEQVQTNIGLMLGQKYDLSILSDQKILASRKLEDDEEYLTVKFKKTEKSCYSSLSTSINEDVEYDGIMNRCIVCTSYIENYHPKQLCIEKPWITNNFFHDTQRAIFDLARAPIEVSEKDYRYTAPSINISSCRCPNTSCSIHGSGLTVGTWCEKYNKKLSNGQKNCPSCGKDLSNVKGAVNIPGDGLDSYSYEEQFNKNPFITGFEIELGEKCSFRVSGKSSESNIWESLLDVQYDEIDDLFFYTRMSAPLSIDSDYPKRYRINNIGKRYRYMQLEVDPIGSFEKIEYSDFSVVSGFFVTVNGHFENLGDFEWENVICQISYNSDKPTQTNYLSYATLNETKIALTLYFKSALKDLDVQSISIYPQRFHSTVNKFKVYGFHYQPSKLTITGESKQKVFDFDQNKFKYNMDEYPTQILDVTLGKQQSGGIRLERADSENDLVYLIIPKIVKAEEDGFQTIHMGNGTITLPNYRLYTAYSIVCGNYYFDYRRNRIILPKYGYTFKNIDKFNGKSIKEVIDEIKNGNYYQKIDLKNLEKGINNQANKYGITYFPTHLCIDYWTGSGLPITLKAQAIGQGPSYQLEKNSITKIETYDLFPDNGTTEMMPDMNGMYQRREIPWVCTNLTPSTLSYSSQMTMGGTFMLPETPSTYLGKTVDNDKYFLDRFGEHNEGIMGKCVTEVTFYGAPNQVISGNIVVTALAQTSTTMTVNGERINMLSERTGGIDQGGFIVHVEIPERKGRATLAFSKPVLVIYARERGENESLSSR